MVDAHTANTRPRNGGKYMTDWISVQEKLPPEYGKYLVVYRILDSTSVDIMIYDTVQKQWLNHQDGVVTHWVPLPEPPKF